MGKSKKKSKERNYINEANEWQQYQYSPGHYVGKTPYIGKKKATGKLYIGTGIFLIAFIIAVFLRFYEGEQLPYYILGFIVFWRWN